MITTVLKYVAVAVITIAAVLFPTLAFADATGGGSFDIYNVIYLALAGAGSWLLTQVARYIRTSNRNAVVKGILLRITDAADKVVPALSERVVKALKRRFGNVPKEDQVIVKQQATFEIKDILGEKFLKDAAKDLGVDEKAVDLYISDAIESKVSELNSKTPANIATEARKAVDEFKGVLDSVTGAFKK